VLRSRGAEKCIPELEPEPKLRIVAPAPFYRGKICINPKEIAGTQVKKVIFKVSYKTIQRCSRNSVFGGYTEPEPKEMFSAMQHRFILLYFKAKLFCRIRNRRQILGFFIHSLSICEILLSHISTFS
jgi:hypothetical protein